MLFIQLLIFGLIFLIAPLAVGAFFLDKAPKHAEGAFAWVSGQMLLWAVFQVICVPLILLEQGFLVVVWLFGGVTVLLALGGILYGVRKHKQTLPGERCAAKEHVPASRAVKVLWLIFAVLLLVQLVLAVVLAYEEGDDAYYVAVSTLTLDSELMYQKHPYSVGYMGLDSRHGLAPFPIWISFLSKISGIKAVTMAQVVLPLGLILMTYGIYYIVGTLLFEKKRELLPLFMIFIAVIVFFGGYSTYSAENFLLVRTAQGKAVIANIVLPFMVCLFLQILNALEKQENDLGKYWFLMGLTMVTGCLCSTLGSLLTCMLVGIVGTCAIVCYRKWKLLFPMALCCVCPVVCAFLYFVFR